MKHFSFSSRSGKSPRILQIGQGNFKYQESWAKVGKFHNFGQKVFGLQQVFCSFLSVWKCWFFFLACSILLVTPWKRSFLMAKWLVLQTDFASTSLWRQDSFEASKQSHYHHQADITNNDTKNAKSSIHYNPSISLMLKSAEIVERTIKSQHNKNLL